MYSALIVTLAGVGLAEHTYEGRGGTRFQNQGVEFSPVRIGLSGFKIVLPLFRDGQSSQTNHDVLKFLTHDSSSFQKVQ
jgi:hypothetical protein